MPNNLIVNQKSVRDLFQDNKTDFLVSDYQRPYLGARRGVAHCGMISSNLQFLMLMLLSSERTKMNTSLVLSFHFLMNLNNWRFLMDSRDLRRLYSC